MNTRDTIILSNRIELPGLLYNETSLEEKFQNQTLRPILKFQNDLSPWVLKSQNCGLNMFVSAYSTIVWDHKILPVLG